MSTELIYQTVSTSLESTAKLAEKLGAKLRGGEVVELVSDLGGGKTTFVRGLAKGMGSLDKVASPSFTISREYNAGALTLYHFDFYRLNDAGIVANEISEIIGDKNTVVAVEWANIIENILPAKRLTIIIKSTGETTREFTFKCPNTLEYLLPGQD